MTRQFCLILFLLLCFSFQWSESESALTNDAGPPVQFVSRTILELLTSYLQGQECQDVAFYLAGRTPFPSTAQVEMQKYTSTDGQGFECSKALDFWNYDLVPLALFSQNVVNQPRHIKRLLTRALAKAGPRLNETVKWVKNLPDAEVLTDSNVRSIDKNLIEDDILEKDEIEGEAFQLKESTPISNQQDREELSVEPEPENPESSDLIGDDVDNQYDKQETQNFTPAAAVAVNHQEVQLTTVITVEKLEGEASMNSVAETPNTMQIPIPDDDNSGTMQLENQPQARPNPTAATIPALPEEDLDSSDQEQAPHGPDSESRNDAKEFRAAQLPTTLSSVFIKSQDTEVLNLGHSTTTKTPINQSRKIEIKTQQESFEISKPVSPQEQDVINLNDSELKEPLSAGPSEINVPSTFAPQAKEIKENDQQPPVTSSDQASPVQITRVQETTPAEWKSTSKPYSTIELTSEVVAQSKPVDSKDEARIVGVIPDDDLSDKLLNLLLGEGPNNMSRTSTQAPPDSRPKLTTRRGRLHRRLRHQMSKKEANDLKREELIRYISMAVVAVLGLTLSSYTCVLCVQCWNKRGPCSHGRHHRHDDAGFGGSTDADLIRHVQLTNACLDGIQERYNSTSGVVNSSAEEIYMIDENGNRVRRSRHRKLDLEPGVCGAAGLPVALVQPNPRTEVAGDRISFGHGNTETEVLS